MSASDLEPPLKRPRPSAPPPARGGDAGALGASFESSGGSVSVRRLLLDLARGVGRADFAAHRAAELAAAEENMGLSAAERAAERAGLVAPAALALAAEVGAAGVGRTRALQRGACESSFRCFKPPLCACGGG